MKKLIFILTLGVTCFTSCKSQQQEKNKQITVTIEPLRYFTESIVGNYYKINCIVPKGSSPETYDPTPQQLINLSHSEALLYFGYLGFEQLWIQRLEENTPQTQFFNLSANIDLIKANEQNHQSHEHRGGIEPHLWNSPKNAVIILENIFNTLCSLDSTNVAFYRSNYEKEKVKIRETKELIDSILNQPKSSKSFMIYHPALTYFAKEYHLTQLSIEEDGKEPSPNQLKKLIEKAKKENVKVIFVQPEFDEKNAALIAKEINAQIIPINPLSYNWHEEIIKIATALN